MFRLEIDAWDDSDFEFAINIVPGQGMMLESIGENGVEAVGFAPGRWAIGNVVEVETDLEQVRGRLSTHGKIQEFRRKGWARVRVVANEENGRSAVYGPVAASYDVGEEGEDQSGEELVEVIEMPLQGAWIVGNGPFARTHAGTWAYDLAKANGAFLRFRGEEWRDNESYFAWNQPIVSPVDGIVLRVRSTEPDSTPGVESTSSRDNMIIIQDTARRMRYKLAHCRRNSVAVGVGDEVRVGQHLARVGNSGRSRSPHLHLEGRRETDNRTVPLAFRNVTVRLNASEADPWKRVFTTWRVREGFIVQGIAGGQEESAPEERERVSRGPRWYAALANDEPSGR